METTLGVTRRRAALQPDPWPGRLRYVPRSLPSTADPFRPRPWTLSPLVFGLVWLATVSSHSRRHGPVLSPPSDRDHRDDTDRRSIASERRDRSLSESRDDRSLLQAPGRRHKTGRHPSLCRIRRPPPHFPR